MSPFYYNFNSYWFQSNLKNELFLFLYFTKRGVQSCQRNKFGSIEISEFSPNLDICTGYRVQLRKKINLYLDLNIYLNIICYYLMYIEALDYLYINIYPKKHSCIITTKTKPIESVVQCTKSSLRIYFNEERVAALFCTI